MSQFADPAAVPDQATFSLDGFFTRLQGAGFQLRPDDYAEVLKVLTTFSPRTPDELAALIAPLIVTNEEEQKRFYALFAEQQRTGTTVVVKPPTFWQQLRRLGWYWLIPLLILLCAVVWYQFFYGPPKPNPPASTQAAPETTTPVATKAPTPSRYLSIVSSSGSVVQASRLNPYHVWIPGGLALLCAAGAVYLLRRTRRQAQQTTATEADALTSRFTSKRPPYVLPLPNRESELVPPSRAFDEFVTTLRQCSEDEVSTLNVSRTLAATVRAGGMPELIFSHRLREEEFLFLIDTSRTRSQQLHLFEFLFRALSRESVYVERFFYQTPFGQFHNERFPNGLSLNELANRYQTSILVLWGDGYPLLFDEYAILDPAFIGGLRRWEHRAILTPVPFPDWDHRERALRAEFLVLPADMAGQLRLMRALQDNQPDQTAYLNTRTDLYSTADVDFKNVSELRAYLGDDLFQWLCATAVYGKVRWEVLIEMGRAVLPDPADVSIPNLLKLARISWLRDGNFPDALRLELLKAVRPDNEVKARQALLELLHYADVHYSDGYFFDEERYLLRTTNQFVLYTHQPDQYADYEPAAREYEQLWRGKKLPDGTMRLYLDNPAKGWDNLLGEGPSRVRLTDQFAPDAPPAPRPERRWAYALAGLGAALLGYLGYLLWQKPAFAQVDEPVTYTFVFRPNACMSLATLQGRKVTLTGLEQAIPLSFRDSIATVSLSAGGATAERATLLVENKYNDDTIGISLTAQRHVFEMRGEDCEPAQPVDVIITYGSSNQRKIVQTYTNDISVLKPVGNWQLRIRSTLFTNLRKRANSIVYYSNAGLLPVARQLAEYVKVKSGQREDIETSLADSNTGHSSFGEDSVITQIQRPIGSIDIVMALPESKFVPCPPNCPNTIVASTKPYATNNVGQRITPPSSTTAFKEGETCPPICRDESGRLLTGTRSTTASSARKAPATTNTGKASPAQETNQSVEQTATPAQKTPETPLITAPGNDWVMLKLLQYKQLGNGRFELTGDDNYAGGDYPVEKYSLVSLFLLPVGSNLNNSDFSLNDLSDNLQYNFHAKSVAARNCKQFDDVPKYLQSLWSAVPNWNNDFERSKANKEITIWVGVFGHRPKATAK